MKSTATFELASRLALLRLSGAFERTLVELFAPDYEQLVKDAKSRLSKEYGQVTR
jgi:hypothetical protein